MDYSVLKKWCEQSGTHNVKIDAISRYGNQVSIRLWDRKQLVFVLDSKDAFVYSAKASTVHDERIWPFLKHALLKQPEIDPADRIITWKLQHIDIYNQMRWYLLIAELMPPKPNLILCEMKQFKPIVVDAIHKYSLADNPARQVLPNFEYMPPLTRWKPKETKLDPPYTLTDLQSGETFSYEDVNSYLAAYHQRVIIAQQELGRRKRMIAGWDKLIAKQEKKLAKQQRELATAEDMETWRLYAEVIKYNLNVIKQGDDSLEAINYFDEAMPKIRIPLKPELSPQANLRMYIKRYQKAKNGLEVIKQNIQKGHEELEQLKSAKARVEAGEDLDPAIGQDRQQKGHSKLSLLDKLLKIKVSDEFEIVIGRKAKENDFISTRLGRPHDWWFHTRVFRGAHVLLRCYRKTEPPEELKRICCSLAAWFSKARFSTNVPIDYTQVRFLRKPRGSAPGFVTYTNQQTAYVDPLDPRQAREILGL